MKSVGAVFAKLLAAQLNKVTDFMVPGIILCVYSPKPVFAMYPVPTKSSSFT